MNSQKDPEDSLSQKIDRDPERLVDVFSLNPSIHGIGIDLKKLYSYFTTKMRVSGHSEISAYLCSKYEKAIDAYGSFLSGILIGVMSVLVFVVLIIYNLPTDESQTKKALSLAPSMVWPVNGKLITSAKWKGSPGLNLSVTDPLVRSAGDGTVSYWGNESQTIGNLLVIEHENNFKTVYLGLEDVMVKIGENVTKGQAIGHLSNTNEGNSILHFGIYYGRYAIDPNRLLKFK